jgi:hypothetical protein
VPVPVVPQALCGAPAGPFSKALLVGFLRFGDEGDIGCWPSDAVYCTLLSSDGGE